MCFVHVGLGPGGTGGSPVAPCSLYSFPPPPVGCLHSASFLLSPKGCGVHSWVISGFCNNDLETSRWWWGMMHCSGSSLCQAESPFTHLWLFLQLQLPGAPTLSEFPTPSPTGKAHRGMRPARGCTAPQRQGWVWGQKSRSALAKGGLATGCKPYTNLVPSLGDHWGLIVWGPRDHICEVYPFIPQSLSPVVCLPLCSGLRTQKRGSSLSLGSLPCRGGTEHGSGPDFQLLSCWAV